MSNYVIMTDATSDINSAMMKKYDIADLLHGILYYPDGHSELQDTDWGNISPEEFYHSLTRKNVMYKTAAPALGEITEVFEKHLAAGEDIIMVTISTGLSSTNNDCKLVAKDLLEKYPERKITVIDSLRYSTCLGLLVIDAAQKRTAGMGYDELVTYIETEKNKIHQMGTMDDLFFLVKTGRISNFKAFFGSRIGLNLCADINYEGMSEPIGKFKGKKDALLADVEYIKRTIVNPEEQTLIISHSNRKEVAEQYKQMILDAIHPKDIIITDICTGCGANIGPGLCVCYYKGEAISKGLEKEKQIMAEIAEMIKANKK